MNDIKLERMRYSKDSLSSLLCIVAILFNVFYFFATYNTNAAFYYTPLMFLSVITNLLFMLIIFLCEEEVKNYNKVFSFVMLFFAIIQIVRIFIYPFKAFNSDPQIITTEYFIKLVIYLSISSLSLIAGGIFSLVNSLKLSNYLKKIKK